MSDEIDEEWAEAGRRGWAQTVQERAADLLSALLAETSTVGSEMGKAHIEEFRAKIRDLTNGEIDPGNEADLFVLGQLHKLDEPRVRAIFQAQVDQLVEAYVAAGHPAPPPVTISSLPSGSVNAICGKDPIDGSIHIFGDAELLTFIQSLGKLVSSCVRPFPLGEARFAPLRIDDRRIQFDRQFAERVLDLFHSIVFHGRARASKPWIPDGMTALQAVFLTWSMARFCVAHELAHAFEGHLDGDSLSAEPAPGASLFAQGQELDADRVAVELCNLKAEHGVYPDMDEVAPYVFLKGVSLLEDCQAVFQTPGARSGLGHPATPERLENLKMAYVKKVAELPHQIIRLRVTFNLDLLFEAWREALISSLEAAKAAGRTPDLNRTPLVPKVERPAILGG